MQEGYCSLDLEASFGKGESNHNGLANIAEWVSELSDTLANSAAEELCQNHMSSADSSSDLKHSHSNTSFSTYHLEFDLFLKDSDIHDLDPNLKAQDFDELRQNFLQNSFEKDFSDEEWEGKFKSWHKYADTYAGEDSLKAMHYALLPDRHAFAASLGHGPKIEDVHLGRQTERVQL